MADVIPAICENLINDDINMFRTIAINNTKIFKIINHDKNEMHNKYYHIVDNIYVRNKIRPNNDKVRKCVIDIIENYDKLAGTNYADDIVYNVS